MRRYATSNYYFGQYFYYDGITNLLQGDWGIDDRPEKLDGLSIQDPNKPDNNISGGSRKAGDVFRAFAAAYDTLSDRMDAAKSGQNIGTSLLGHVLGGNYNSYIMQRRHLKTLE